MRLGLDRVDYRWLLGLTLVAFVFRFFSPIFPDFLAHPFSGAPFSDCVHQTPVDAHGDLGTLCGLAYPFQRGYPSGGGAYQPPNGQVFDEIYFATFAHNDLKGLEHPCADPAQSPCYFDPEPPLSKLIIAGGQLGWGWFRVTFQGAKGDYADLGFNTFGWRIMSCLFGTLCVPMIYLLARRLWNENRVFAIAAATLVAFDGMFFIQSRIGMIDIFPIFFILAAYWVYLLHRGSTTERSSLISLFALGIVLGLAVAAKWIALAALASIIALLLIELVWRWIQTGEPRFAGGARMEIYLPAAIVALLAIPVAIYVASWIPFFERGQFHTLADLWNYNVEAYRYHAGLTATHPYGSPWWTWPLLLRPVAYYYQGSGLGLDQWSHRELVAGMVNLGNPFIWWASLPCVAALPWIAYRYRSFPAAVILLGFVTQYLPWTRITRVVFLYHMFGGLTFMILALALVLALLVREGLPRPAVAASLAVAVAAFLYFYPVWTATPISDLAYLGGLPKTMDVRGVPPWGGKMWLQANCSQPAHPNTSSWIPCWI